MECDVGPESASMEVQTWLFRPPVDIVMSCPLLSANIFPFPILRIKRGFRVPPFPHLHALVSVTTSTLIGAVSGHVDVSGATVSVFIRNWRHVTHLV